MARLEQELDERVTGGIDVAELEGETASRTGAALGRIADLVEGARQTAGEWEREIATMQNRLALRSGSAVANPIHLNRASCL